MLQLSTPCLSRPTGRDKQGGFAFHYTNREVGLPVGVS